MKEDEFFNDLGHLRRIPLTWLVPDETLLPPESVRFFFLDEGFLRHLFAGACAAGALGVEESTLDAQRALQRLAVVKDDWSQQIRKAADIEYRIRNIQLPGMPALGPPDDRHLYQPTGLLLRSEAVRRYPGMRVSATARFEPVPGPQTLVQLPLLRLERVAPGILLALFMGIPERIEIEEPDVGTRFGFDAPTQANPLVSIQIRDIDGTLRPQGVAVPMRTATVVDVRALSQRLASHGAPGQAAGALDSAALAYQLQQATYVQVCTPMPEDGSEDAALGAVQAEITADAAARVRARVLP